MDIFEHLEQDHRSFMKLIKKIENANDAGQAENLQQSFAQLHAEIIKHARAEERTFYSALMQFEEAQELIEEATDDHKMVESLASEIASMAISDEQWMERFQELKQNIEDHIEQEETEIFDEARKLLEENEPETLEKTFSQEENRVSPA